MSHFPAFAHSMKKSTVAQNNANISLRGERVLVAGGTQGIGEAVACRFARAGAEVGILGRNEAKAMAILEKLKEISEEQRIEPPPEHYFLKADLSLVSEAKRVAEAIRIRASPQGIDYLVMTQGGPPNGTFVPTSESYDQHYGVQVLSRFILAYKLAGHPTSSIIKKAVMSVLSPGLKIVAVEPDDIDMFKAKEHGTYGIRAAMCRDSAVVDAFTEEFAARNPNLNFTHVWPGAVKTDFRRNSEQPWYISLVWALAWSLMGTSPEAYAEVPFYLLAHPDGRAFAAKEKYSDENVGRVEPHPLAKDGKQRAKIWNHLEEIAKIN